MGSKNHQKSYNLHSIQKTLFWGDAYAQIWSKVNFKQGSYILYRSNLRPLISTLRACIAPHVALENALGPPSTTQRPFNNTLRACIAPYVELENTLRPHDIVPLKDHSTALIYTVEQHPESLYSPSRTTQSPMISALKACIALMWHWDAIIIINF